LFGVEDGLFQHCANAAKSHTTAASGIFDCRFAIADFLFNAICNLQFPHRPAVRRVHYFAWGMG
jgi:hypothetical protein